MAKINRVYQKIFGGTGVTSDFGEFGSLAAGSPTTTKDPATIQSLGAWLGGWAQATIGSLIPAYQDMNSVHFLAFYQICYLFQMGIAEWDSQTEYCIGSIIQYNSLLYNSLQNANINQEPDTQFTFWQQGLPGAELTGVLKEYAGSVAPAGYLMADGSAVSRTTYARLFAVCGTNYGIGDGTTTFNIPDKRRNVGVGYKAGDPNFGTLGQIGGEATHTLTIPEMPSHTHSYTGHTGIGSDAGAVAGGFGGSSFTTTSTSTGGDGAHNNLPPYQVFNYIIKT